jgi:hypothetical protein
VSSANALTPVATHAVSKKATVENLILGDMHFLPFFLAHNVGALCNTGRGRPSAHNPSSNLCQRQHHRNGIG